MKKEKGIEIHRFHRLKENVSMQDKFKRQLNR